MDNNVNNSNQEKILQTLINLKYFIPLIAKETVDQNCFLIIDDDTSYLPIYLNEEDIDIEKIKLRENEFLYLEQLDMIEIDKILLPILTIKYIEVNAFNEKIYVSIDKIKKVIGT